MLYKQTKNSFYFRKRIDSFSWHESDNNFPTIQNLKPNWFPPRESIQEQIGSKFAVASSYQLDPPNKKGPWKQFTLFYVFNNKNTFCFSFMTSIK